METIMGIKEADVDKIIDSEDIDAYNKKVISDNVSTDLVDIDTKNADKEDKIVKKDDDKKELNVIQQHNIIFRKFINHTMNEIKTNKDNKIVTTYLSSVVAGAMNMLAIRDMLVKHPITFPLHDNIVLFILTKRCSMNKEHKGETYNLYKNDGECVMKKFSSVCHEKVF
jgi:hypothetical protein